MMKTVGLLVVLGCLLGCAWWVLGSDEVSDTSASLGRLDTSVGALDTVGTDEASGGERAVVVAVEEASLPAAVEILAAPEGGVELELVRWEAGALVPAAGALAYQVSLSHLDRQTWPDELLLRGAGVSAELLDLATCYQADEQGHVVVRDTQKGSLIFAELGVERAFSGLNTRFQLGWRMELRESRSLRIRVEDEFGHGVAGQQIDVEGSLGGLWRYGVETGADGEVELFNANTYLPVLRSMKRELGLSMTPWAESTVRALVDLQDLPSEPVVMRVLRGTDVAVTLVDAAGEPVGSGLFMVDLEVDLEAGVSSKRSKSLTHESQATFKDVPRGRQFEVRVWQGEMLGTKPQFAKGMIPLEGSLDLTVEVGEVLASDLTVRLVDEQGRPFREVEIDFDTRVRTPDGGGTMSSWAKTNSDGIFTWVFDEDDSKIDGNGSLEMGFELRKPEGTWSVDLEPMVGPLGLPMDLGNVVMEPQPLLLSGRVVNRLGEPLAGVRVMVISNESRAEVMQGEGRSVSSFASDHEGRFQVFGVPTKPFLAAAISLRYGVSGEIVAIVPGQTDLELVHDTPGSLMGSIVVPDGIGSVPITVGVQFADERGELYPKSLFGTQRIGGEWATTGVTASGLFGWSDLPAGRYNVFLNVLGAEQPQLLWEQVEVLGGAVTRDPRLQKVDVSQWMSTVRVSVEDRNGQWIGQALCSSLGGSRTIFRELVPQDGLLIAGALPCVICVQAKGYLARAVSLDSKATVVTLDSAPTVTLVLPSHLTIPEGMVLSARLKGTVGAKLGTEYAAVSERIEFSEGRATIAARILGPSSVEFERYAPNGTGGDRMAYWDGEVELEIDVPMGASEFVLDLDQVQLDKLLQL